MATCLGLDYWLVPELNATQVGAYFPTEEGVQAVVNTLRRVLITHNLSYLIWGYEEYMKGASVLYLF